MKVASRSVVWTVALNLIGFSMMRHMVNRELAFADVDGNLQRGGERAVITHWTRDSGPQHLLH